MTIRFLARALKTAQVKNYAFGGTIATSDIYTATINGKTASFTVAGTTTAAAVSAGLYAALVARTETEFTTLTFADAVGSINVTGQTTGRPFSLTIASTGAGTISGTGAGTTTIASSSPNHWNVAANWSGGAVPVNADNVVVDLEGAEILWGLDQSAVTLASLIVSGLRCKIGLPKINADGYTEDLIDYLSIGATICRIGVGAGPGPDRCKINFGTVQTTCEIVKSGQGESEGIPAVLLKGTHASNVVDAPGGSTGIAHYADEVSTVVTLKIGINAEVWTGVAVTLTDVKNSGKYHGNTNTTTYFQYAGSAELKGTSAHANIDVSGGDLSYQSSGTAAAVAVGPGKIDTSVDPSARIFSATTFRKDGIVNDPAKTITFTAIAVDAQCHGLQGI